MAEKRLSFLRKRLRMDPVMKDRYTEGIHMLIEKKETEPVPDDERRLLQRLCRIKKKCDEPLSPEVTEAWGRWLDHLTLLAGFQYSQV